MHPISRVLQIFRHRMSAVHANIILAILSYQFISCKSSVVMEWKRIGIMIAWCLFAIKRVCCLKLFGNIVMSPAVAWLNQASRAKQRSRPSEIARARKLEPKFCLKPGVLKYACLRPLQKYVTVVYRYTVSRRCLLVFLERARMCVAPVKNSRSVETKTLSEHFYDMFSISSPFLFIHRSHGVLCCILTKCWRKFLRVLWA